MSSARSTYRAVQYSDSATRLSIQHPGVLAAAALRRVDDERALAERGAGEPARDDPDAVGAAQHERAQVDVAAVQAAADERRVAGQCDGRLSDVVARRLRDTLAELVALGRGRGRPDEHPVPAGLVDGLH